MSTVNSKRVFLYNPGDASEVTRFFGVCSNLNKNGRDVRVLVDSSGYFTRRGDGELTLIKESGEIEVFSEKGDMCVYDMRLPFLPLSWALHSRPVAEGASV